MTAKNIVTEFGAREGTVRAKILATLAASFKKQVPVTVLVKKAYGEMNDEWKHAVKMSIKGALATIKSTKLAYEIKKERGEDGVTFGLYPKRTR